MFKPKYLRHLAFPLILALWLAFTIGQISAQDNITCQVGQGYWKNTPTWPVSKIKLGSQTYTQVEVLILLNTPPEGDASLILAHQLIAAKLNVAKGLDSTVVAGVITQGDALLSSFTGRLPYHVAPSDTTGQTLVNLSTILDSYNQGQLTVGCLLPATLTPTPALPATVTPQVTATPMPEATPEATPESTAQPGAPVIIVIEGPVQAINVNIITIYNINIQLADNDPNLKIIQVGDIVRIEGTPQGSVVTGNITIVAITVVVINVDIDVSTGEVWHDDTNSCANPPPPWAPANGWRRRCEGKDNKGDKHDNKDDKKHGKHDD
jgi:hypothetical protein